MHLKTLTLKGFKSFASTTRLRFEPGVTCVVGPNGSGKSNVVDAIAWVLGEQGAKALRGGKMDDVIFAGTSGRSQLGRAEVTLTIDNSDNALPIEYTEVSITRRLFRTGESEYEINGDACRLLDIQELLSDSGIGKEMHVLVGQGQLDAVLTARSEDRRAFIEEAAGVLKHRKRKEKAVRKLTAMQGNLNRLSDLTTEVRRQLKPLGKQAQVAKRAASIQAELRDAKLRLLADDFHTLHAEMERESADEAAMLRERAAVEQKLHEASQRRDACESAVQEIKPQLETASDAWYRLLTLQERFTSTHRIATERYKHLSSVSREPRSQRDPEKLEGEACTLRAQHAELMEEITEAKRALEAAAQERRRTELSAEEAEKEHMRIVRALSDRREGIARLEGRVSAARSRVSAAREELDTLHTSVAEAHSRAETSHAEASVMAAEVEGITTGDVSFDQRHTTAQLTLTEARTHLDTLGTELRSAEKKASEWGARADALATGLQRKDGSSALLSSHDHSESVHGSIAAVVSVTSGCEAALAAALGSLAGGVVVSDLASAASAAAKLRADDEGYVSMLIAHGSSAHTTPTAWPALPEEAQWLIECVDVPGKYREKILPGLFHVLERVAVVDDLDSACALVQRIPSVRVVTRDGDVVTTATLSGGSHSVPSVIEVQAAVEEAREKHAVALRHRDEISTRVKTAERSVADAESAARDALRKLRESDAQISAAQQRLTQLRSRAEAHAADVERIQRQIAATEKKRDEAQSNFVELEQRLADVQDTPAEEEPPTQHRDELLAAASAARAEEMELRLSMRTTEERARAVENRATSLERAAANERREQQRAEEAARRSARAARVCERIIEAAATSLTAVENSLNDVAQMRDAATQKLAERETQLRALHKEIQGCNTDLERLTDSVHRDQLARAQQRVRIEQLAATSTQEYWEDMPVLLSEYGPDVSVAPTQVEVEAAEKAGEEPPSASPYRRDVQEKRAQRAERDLKLLGKVNPLALEEFAALEERHQFLSEQLEDVKATRKELLSVVSDVDERIQQVFASAFEDTAREFDKVFATLFPGGDGRLVLTDPENLLTTGVEVEACPPGKKVKRLSLLSGGERSLTAIALLLAIFRARPSPFYLLDEVEAALDDTNLGRLLEALRQLSESSQLLIITHQKRTMEVADALYGVSMQRDGITRVVSQKLTQFHSEP